MKATSNPDNVWLEQQAELKHLEAELIEKASRCLELRKALKARGRAGHAVESSRSGEELSRLVPPDPPPALRTALLSYLEEDVQSRDLAEEIEVPLSATPRKIAIVGGGGQMGRMFGDALSRRGHQIDAIELGDGRGELRDRVRDADTVMIAVPMHCAVEVAHQVVPWVRPEALLCDINSLKSEICQVFAVHSPGQALGTHPMFGPTVHSLRRQKVVVCPVKTGPRVDEFLEELEILGMALISATPAEHDRMMAAVQVLVHFNTLVMGDALRRSGVSVHESLKFTSPIYRLELAFVGRLFTQDPALYAEIEMQNPYSAEVLSHYSDAVKELQLLIGREDREGFSALFRSLTGYFSDFGEESMQLSDYVIDTIVARSRSEH